MKITALEVFPISIAYKHPEVSSVINRGGVSNVIVRITTDTGLTGWGECSAPGDTASIEAAARAAEPFLLGRDPWNRESIASDYFQTGIWNFQPMTGNLAFAGIDMALWDLCGKACGQPLYKLLGGAQRSSVNYFYYLSWGDEDSLRAQCEDGLRAGYDVFYLKIGRDEVAEEDMLRAVRSAIGPARRLRIDANQSWSVPQAVRLIESWHEQFRLDFVEAPVRVDPIENMAAVAARVKAPLCANEGLWREIDAMRVIQSRTVDYLCFSQFWVGSLRRFQTLGFLAHANGQLVCKHTHGEFGIAATAAQHVLLSLPSEAGGHQQTARMMLDDIVVERIATADAPDWGLIEEPGLGVTIDEVKLKKYHQVYMNDGEYIPYGDGFRARQKAA